MPKPFALSVKGVIRDEQGRWLMIRRSAASRHNAGEWDFPGGKIDPGESFETALIREILEETGLKVELDAVLGAAESELPTLRVAYLILGAKITGGALQLSAEHDDSRWVGLDELDSLSLCHQFRPFVRSLIDASRSA
jgi:8-oxo-dGTP diphosphatase